MSEKKSKLDGNSVDRPLHYTSHPSGIEAIEVCGEMGFNTGNAFKYLMRLDKKWDTLEDLAKANWYTHREIWQRSGLTVDNLKFQLAYTYDEQFKDDFKSLDKFQFGIPFQQVLNIKRIIETTPGNVGKAMFYIWEADLVFGIDKLMAAGAYITAEIEARKLLN